MKNQTLFAARCAALAATLFLSGVAAFAEEQKKTEAASAYAELLKKIDDRPASIPEAKWREANAAELEKFAAKYAGQPEAGEARRNRLQQLQDAARIDPSVKPAFIAASDAVWKDAKLEADERANARLLQLNLMHNDAVPGDELLILWQEFPGCDTVAASLATRAVETEDAALRTRMLEPLRDTPGLPDRRREFANKILSGEVRPLAARVGEPYSLSFKALDGREVNTEKLKGKVVLLDFWATWCPPCVAGIPELKKTYTELHDQGLEVIGINFDDQKPKLEKFVQKEGLSWPQYFDGKGWDNTIGKSLGLRSLPTMALIDKKGLVRFPNGRENFAEKVKQLLAE